MVRNVKSQDFRGAPRLSFLIRICVLIESIFPFLLGKSQHYLLGYEGLIFARLKNYKKAIKFCFHASALWFVGFLIEAITRITSLNLCAQVNVIPIRALTLCGSTRSTRINATQGETNVHRAEHGDL
jgi:hypothetical protein